MVTDTGLSFRRRREAELVAVGCGFSTGGVGMTPAFVRICGAGFVATRVDDAPACDLWMVVRGTDTVRGEVRTLFVPVVVGRLAWVV